MRLHEKGTLGQPRPPKKGGAHIEGAFEVEGRHLELLLPVLQLPQPIPAQPPELI